jgi:hypothetical protein
VDAEGVLLAGAKLWRPGGAGVRPCMARRALACAVKVARSSGCREAWRRLLLGTVGVLDGGRPWCGIAVAQDGAEPRGGAVWSSPMKVAQTGARAWD